MNICVSVLYPLLFYSSGMPTKIEKYHLYEKNIFQNKYNLNQNFRTLTAYSTSIQLLISTTKNIVQRCRNGYLSMFTLERRSLQNIY